MASILGSFPFLIAVGACGLALAIGGLWLVRRYVSHETLMTHHDVASCMLSVIGTLYAVVLGLMVVGALSRFQQARQTVEMEANTLHDVFHLAQGLPKPLVTKVRQDCRSYATLVINEEWRLMEEGNESSDARAVMSELWSVVTEFKPADSGETNLQQTLLQELDQLGDCRNSRLLDSKVTFDPYIWSAIISGGFILIAFTYFFGVENFAVQALMTGLVTIVLAINLLIVALFAYPYSGDVKVNPQPFANDLAEFK